MNNTKLFGIHEIEKEIIKEDILRVCKALEDRGYNPVSQLAGYIVSNDPAYITSFDGARKIITELGRDDLLENILNIFIENLKKEE